MQSESSGQTDDEFVNLLTCVQVPLLLYVRSLMPGDLAVRDVAQQANARIWEKRAEFELGTNFQAWAFAIARFEVLSYRKRQARDARLRFSEELEQTFADELAEAADEVEQRHEALRACIEKLRPRDRDLIWHRYSHSGTLAEFAERQGRSLGGLKVTLHRLRSALLVCIERRLASGESTA